MLDDDLTERLPDGQDKILAKKILEKSRRAADTGQAVLTSFLDPHEQQVAESVLQRIPGSYYYAYGGYPGAERVRMAVMPGALRNVVPDLEIEFLMVKSDAEFSVLISHRDVLGAVMSLGIKRNTVGDILIYSDNAKLAVKKEMAVFILNNLQRINKKGVTVETISAQEYAPEPGKTKIIRGTVASLRLDSVAGLGYSLSRTKMAAAIKGEQVKVNWRPIRNPAAVVKEGDILSFAGKGRVEIFAVGGESKKGRTRVELKRFL